MLLKEYGSFATNKDGSEAKKRYLSSLHMHVCIRVSEAVESTRLLDTQWVSWFSTSLGQTKQRKMSLRSSGAWLETWKGRNLTWYTQWVRPCLDRQVGIVFVANILLLEFLPTADLQLAHKRLVYYPSLQKVVPSINDVRMAFRHCMHACNHMEKCQFAHQRLHAHQNKKLYMAEFIPIWQITSHLSSKVWKISGGIYS